MLLISDLYPEYIKNPYNSTMSNKQLKTEERT